MISFRSYSKKFSFQPISNIELFTIHAKEKLGMLGVPKKLVKDVAHV
jgi:hypothetical protein